MAELDLAQLAKSFSFDLPDDIRKDIEKARVRISGIAPEGVISAINEKINLIHFAPIQLPPETKQAIAQMMEAWDHMALLVSKNSSLSELGKSLDMMLGGISLPTPQPSYIQPNSKYESTENRLCAAIDGIVEKSQKENPGATIIPDERSLQDVAFVIIFYLSTLTPQDIAEWLRMVPELLLAQIESCANASTFLSGFSNLYMMLEISLRIASLFK